jgi:hypothetical protein
MTVLDQSNSRGGNWAEYYRNRRREYKKTPTVYTKREPDGTWSSFTRKGWYKKKRFTTGSKTPYEAKAKHKEKLKLLEGLRWGKSAHRDLLKSKRQRTVRDM